jgi:hypothetical protein
MHKCITTQIDSSLPDLFTASWSPSHNDLSFQITLLAPLQESVLEVEEPLKTNKAEE